MTSGERDGKYNCFSDTYMVVEKRAQDLPESYCDKKARAQTFTNADLRKLDILGLLVSVSRLCRDWNSKPHVTGNAAQFASNLELDEITPVLVLEKNGRPVRYVLAEEYERLTGKSID